MNIGDRVVDKEGRIGTIALVMHGLLPLIHGKVDRGCRFRVNLDTGGAVTAPESFFAPHDGD